VLAHFRAGRQTHLQQFCGSLAAVPASALLLAILSVDVTARFNEKEVGITEL